MKKLRPAASAARYIKIESSKGPRGAVCGAAAIPARLFVAATVSIRRIAWHDRGVAKIP
jgi:hypothetical protein